MTQAYRRLSEGLEARRAPDALSFPTDPKKVKAWTEALPRANHSVAHRQLVEALHSLRELRLEGSQRLGTMEALRPVLLDTIGLLEQQLQGSALPLVPAKAKAMIELQAFEQELAIGYRLAVVEQCAPAGAIPFLRGGAVAQALERAAFHASRLLTQAYFLYCTPGEGQWSMLHALFDFACEVKLDSKAVEEPVEKNPVSVRQLYSQALLLALSNPYRFSQKEQEELWQVTRDFAPHLDLQPDRRSDEHFAIPLDHDQGPGYIPEERADERGRLLWLDLGALRQALEAPLSGSASGPVRVAFKSGRAVHSSAELLRRLRAGWGTSTARRNARLPAGHQLDAVIGLSGLHFHMAGALDFDGFMRQTGVVAFGGERDRATWAQGGLDSSRVPIHRAVVLDQSLGGYRVRWGHEEAVRAKVGELIGLSLGDDADGRLWMLGVIRWLRYASDGSVDAGIELLARRARAVAVRAQDDTGVQRPVLRALQYQPLRDDDPGRLALVASGVLDLFSRRIEVIRTSHDDETIEVESGLETCEDVHVDENAGDFLIISALRKAA